LYPGGLCLQFRVQGLTVQGSHATPVAFCLEGGVCCSASDLHSHRLTILLLPPAVCSAAAVQMPERVPHPNGVLDQRLVSNSPDSAWLRVCMFDGHIILSAVWLWIFVRHRAVSGTAWLSARDTAAQGASHDTATVGSWGRNGYSSRLWWQSKQTVVEASHSRVDDGVSLVFEALSQLMAACLLTKHTAL
jgi:hypothetical protein